MTPEPVPANVQQEPPPFLATVDFSVPEKKRTRAKGKIPALPKAQRDLINHLLDDGATYKTVEIEMAKLDVSLNAENISNWFNGGYQDYLLHQEWLAQMSALRENASDLPCDTAADFKFHQAVLNLAVTQIFSTLKSDKLKDQPADYTRTLNALCRLTRENLLLQKHQDARATQQARQPKQLDVNREISDHERNIVLKRWRDFFGRDLTEPDPAQASLPAPPEPSSTQAATAGVLPTTPEHTSFAADAGAISPQNGTAPVFRASLPETARVHIDSDSCPSQSVEPCTAGAPNAAPLAKIENLVPLPPGNCSACNILLPPLLKNGERVVASI